MAVPKKKTSKSRRDMRRAHDGLVSAVAVVCPNCKKPHLPHQVCLFCGQYKNHQVIVKEEPKDEAAED
jgi:large subunit ribosomal protein L32